MRFNRFTKLIAVLALLGGAYSCAEDTIEDQATGRLEGRVVTNGDNAPVENVKITTSPASNTVFSDSDGNFSIDPINIGEYSVQAELQDFITAFEAANVLAGETSSVVFELDSVDSANSAPLLPRLLSPADSETGVIQDPELIWSSSSNDDDDILYTVELRESNQGQSQVFEVTNDTTLTVNDLRIGRTYFWQVTASDEINAPVVSAFSSFTVQGSSSNRFFFVKNEEGNQVIYSGNEPIGQEADEIDQNVIQLTEDDRNSFRPKANSSANKIAFLGLQGGETHLFTMNIDGTERTQITRNTPVNGFRLDEIEFAWNNDGNKLYYPNFNRLFEVRVDGTQDQLIFTAPAGEFISEVAVNPVNGLLALKTNDNQGYNVRILLVDPATGVIQRVLFEGIGGAFDGLDFSADGNRLLFSRDVSGLESNQYRRLDNRIFEFNFTTDQTEEILTDKPVGDNDLDPKYAPNDGFVIYVRTSNDGISERVIQRTQFTQDLTVVTERLFSGAYMPYWE